MERSIIISVIIFVISCSNHFTQAKNWYDEPEPVINLSKADSLKLAAFWQMAVTNNMKNKSTQEIELSVARWFLATPYLAGSLDQNKEEQLVINFQGLDCVTFVENVVALTQTIKGGNLDNTTFFQHLKTLRYRNGKLDGYASRLHYFTEWLLNNEQKGIISIVSESMGDADFNPFVNILSKNKKNNSHLVDSAVLAKIIASEIEVSKVKLRYITKQHLSIIEDSIHEGDIIAITTSIKGLDIEGSL